MLFSTYIKRLEKVYFIDHSPVTEARNDIAQ